MRGLTQTAQRAASELAAPNLHNAVWQRDLSVSHGRIGDMQVAQNDTDAALKSYQASLTMQRDRGQLSESFSGWIKKFDDALANLR